MILAETPTVVQRCTVGPWLLANSINTRVRAPVPEAPSKMRTL